jgi:hypothetical protein
MCDMVTLGDKDNGLEPTNQIPTLMSSLFDLLTSNSIGNIFLPRIVYMGDIVTLGGKDNGLEPGNHISTLMSSALHLYLLTSKLIGNEITKITISNHSHRKYKSENGCTRTSEYIRGGIRCHGGESIPCRPVTPAMSPISTFDKRHDL